MHSLFARVTRPFAFLRAEIFEVVRQPRLIATLVLGPFLILLLFGIGYRNVARSLRTLFVVPPGSSVAGDIQQFASNLGPQLVFEGVTGDQQAAMDKLRRREVDVVAVVPTNAAEMIRNNQQVTITLYHDEIDPVQANYVQYFGEIYVGEVNRRVIARDLSSALSKLGNIQGPDPQVLVSPFTVQAKSIAPVQLTLVDYFAPSVIVLLLQHLATTFAALSIIRERNLGTMELFRVSPISPGEILTGKYLSYLLFGGLIAAVLSALLIFGLNAPLLGDWRLYAGVIALLLFASLGYGFFISLVSQTDSQAVQYSMILLLASIFFSGFFLSLDNLWAPVRLVSWLLPATYAIQLLQDIMLRGQLPSPFYIGGLAAMGLILFLASILLLRRTMKLS